MTKSQPLWQSLGHNLKQPSWALLWRGHEGHNIDMTAFVFVNLLWISFAKVFGDWEERNGQNVWSKWDKRVCLIKLFKEGMCSIWLLILVRHLYLSGMWSCEVSRMYTKNACLTEIDNTCSKYDYHFRFNNEHSLGDPYTYSMSMTIFGLIVHKMYNLIMH